MNSIDVLRWFGLVMAILSLGWGLWATADAWDDFWTAWHYRLNGHRRRYLVVRGNLFREIVRLFSLSGATAILIMLILKLPSEPLLQLDEANLVILAHFIMDAVIVLVGLLSVNDRAVRNHLNRTQPDHSGDGN